MKKTKIVCTVGPSTDKSGILENLIDAGMDVARFNFSHGNHADHQKRIDAVNAAAAARGKYIGLMADTKGPEMRLGLFANGKENLVEGAKFALTADQTVQGSASQSSVNHPGLYKLLKPGDTILLSDGLISLKVDSVADGVINTTVLNSGEISSRKRVATPGVALDLPFLSEQDTDDILFAAKAGMDFIAASFAQRAEDIIAIRRLLEKNGYSMGLIAKIENAEGVKNINEIIKVSDGVMVARGDLGVEIPTEQVPLVQKHIINRCNEHSIPVITATQMLESMLHNPRPTRAEASDVANAILDGSDAIMLSGETASGSYPVEAVATMSSIAQSTEEALNYDELASGRGKKPDNPTMTDAISHATVQIANELGVSAIVASSESGYTARMIAHYRARAHVIVVTPHAKSARRMQLYWGVQPLLGPAAQTTDAMIGTTIDQALKHDLIKEGEMVVLSAGVPVGMAGSTNLINVIITGDILLRGTGIGKRVIKAKVCVVKSAKDLKKFQPGDIMVIPELEKEAMPKALQASGIIAEEGGLTSQAAIVSVSYGIPAIVGVSQAAKKLKNGMIVTIDASRGVIYHSKDK